MNEVLIMITMKNVIREGHPTLTTVAKEVKRYPLVLKTKNYLKIY
jgi:hypothetical protein